MYLEEMYLEESSWSFLGVEERKTEPQKRWLYSLRMRSEMF